MTETRGRPAFSSFLLALSPRTSKNRDKLSSWKWSSGCSLPFHKGWEAAPWGPVSSRHSSLGSRGETRVLQQEFPGSALLWAASDERASGPSAHGCSVLTLAWPSAQQPPSSALCMLQAWQPMKRAVLRPDEKGRAVLGANRGQQELPARAESTLAAEAAPPSRG